VRTDGQADGQLDMANLIEACCVCANASEMHHVFILKITKRFFDIVLCCDTFFGVNTTNTIYFSRSYEFIIFIYCVTINKTAGTPYRCVPAQTITDNRCVTGLDICLTPSSLMLLVSQRIRFRIMRNLRYPGFNIESSGLLSCYSV
jgi:hypothetical protein